MDLDAQLAALGVRFRENVVDSERAWSKDVEGFRLTLDLLGYEAVMRSADDRAIRHELYESYTTRASDRGPLAGRFDNGPIIDEILALRHEQARLLGYPSHAEHALRKTMARSADEVERLLLELNATVRPRARAELEGVWTFAKARDHLKGFRPWDLPYYTEKLREQGLGSGSATMGEAAVSRPLDVSMRALREIEWALFDLRVHSDYVPADRSSRLRSHVLDTLAQVRREASVLAPPPWDRMASSFLDGFAPAPGEGHGLGAVARVVRRCGDAFGRSIELHPDTPTGPG